MGYYSSGTITGDFNNVSYDGRMIGKLNDVVNEYISTLESAIDYRNDYDEVFHSIVTKCQHYYGSMDGNRTFVWFDGYVFVVYDMGSHHVVAILSNFAKRFVLPLELLKSFPKGRLVFHIPAHGDFKGQEFQFDNR